MSKRFADTEKYKKPFIRSLPAAYKLLWDYICLDCDHAGIWQVDFEVAQIRIGQDANVNEKTALELFNKGEERVKVLNGGSKWFILPFIAFQYGELSQDCKPHRAVLSQLENMGLTLSKGYTKGIDTLMDMDKDKDKDKEERVLGKTRTRFEAPNIEVVDSYCKEHNYTVDPQQFCAFYQANGWKVGKNPMKDWKASVRYWHSKQAKNATQGNLVANNAILTELEKEILLDYKAGRKIQADDAIYIEHNARPYKKALSSLVAAFDGNRAKICTFLDELNKEYGTKLTWTLDTAAKKAWESRK